MYNFSHYKEADKQVLVKFLNDYPFAFLTGSTTSGEQVATQIPILMEERDGEMYLQGHMMRNTDHYKAFVENPKVLSVFTGPNTYVSATWYSNPISGSTWNYMSVHVKGTMRFLPEEDLISFMKKLTLKFENDNIDSPTIFDNLPDEYLKKMLPAIVAFEIKAEEMNNVFKLSQDKNEESYRNIIARLKEQGGNAELVAKEMTQRIKKLF